MNNLITVNLNIEQLKKPIGDMTCFLIVNKPHDDDVIKRIAEELICLSTEYEFYGKFEQAWHTSFDLVGIDRFPDCTEYDVPLTMSEDDLNEFVNDIYIKLDYTESNNVMLIYDDEDIFNKVIKLLSSHIKNL